MKFTPISEAERDNLLKALRGNAQDGKTLLTDRKDTSFTGVSEEVEEVEVISAIKSVPCHYLYG